MNSSPHSARVHTERFSIIPEAVTDSPDLSDGAVRLYAVLRRYANSDDGRCWPSRALLADRLGVNVKTVDRRVHELVEAGFLLIEHRRSEGGDNLTNVYTFPHTGYGGGASEMSPPSDNPVPRGASDVSPPSPTDVALNENQRTRTNELEPTRASDAETDEVRDLCEYLADTVEDRLPTNKRPTVTKAWTREMDRLIRLDGRTPDDIRKVIAWLAKADNEVSAFWAPNVRSPATLRSRWDQMAEQCKRRSKGPSRRSGEERSNGLHAAADRLQQELGL